MKLNLCGKLKIVLMLILTAMIILPSTSLFSAGEENSDFINQKPVKTPKPPVNPADPQTTPSCEIDKMFIASDYASDLRTNLSSGEIIIGTRVFTFDINVTKANPSGAEGIVTFNGLPVNSSTTAPLKGLKLKWNKSLQRAEVSGTATGKDRVTKEQFKVKITGFREGNLLNITAVYEIKLTAPKQTIKGVLPLQAALINPDNITEITFSNFRDYNKSGKTAHLRFDLNVKFPWGDTVGGRGQEKRYDKTFTDGITYVKRQYLTNFTPSKAGFIKFTTNYNPMPDIAPLPFTAPISFKSYNQEIKILPLPQNVTVTYN